MSVDPGEHAKDVDNDSEKGEGEGETEDGNFEKSPYFGGEMRELFA